MKKSLLALGVFGAIALTSCCKTATQDTSALNLERAKISMDSIYANYSVTESKLLRENYPFDKDYTATYLASEDQSSMPNPYAYLWPFSGTLSAANTIMESDKSYITVLTENVLPALEMYLDTTRTPACYSSYIKTAAPSDRFYDDNVWLGIDFCDIYEITSDKQYLDKAEMIWKFIESGIDEQLGGGIYWCEQKKLSKNTCSNAPGSVYAMKLYNATKNAKYLDHAKALYQWTKQNLQDKTDYLYFDNMSLEGNIGEAKYAYNSGQMLQAAALLHKVTGEEAYLTDAQNIAKAAHSHFFEEFTPATGDTFRIIKRGNTWFSAVMVRGFVELYNIDANPTYINDIQRSLDYAWDNARDAKGLFESDFSGVNKDDKKWLLTQGAMVEMYGRMSAVK